MKNSEQPAHPLKEATTNDSLGLTKREYFVAEAMKTTDPPTHYVDKKETEESYKDWGIRVIRMADEILKQLES